MHWEHEFDVCFKMFSQLVNLKRHIFSHSDEQVYHCNICIMAFKRSVNLLSHKLHIHSKNNLFNCDVCSKKFKRKTSMVNHRLFHDEVKPLSCEVCSKKFQCEST